MNKKVLLIGMAIIVPIILILFVNLGRDPRKVTSPLVGREMIDFRLREVGTTRSVDLSSFRGRPIVVNFWATWCVPCHVEHQVLEPGFGEHRERRTRIQRVADVADSHSRG